ncbi:phospholipase B1, membrane-associated [Nematostella vectensis]|uniref:phospholipase B1, membrane-associated n=1 Tax=Nematostella vectensis TaxID=45351 RepID=UPI002076E246|nr:phospholipase B1, membrane-associated [Nematostella vectensis]
MWLPAMASCCCAWKLSVFFISFLFGGSDAVLPVNATSVKVGFILEDPKVENHDASEVVLDGSHINSNLHLLCFIEPRLPQGTDYEIHKNDLVKWEKITYTHQAADSIRYWSNDRTKTAISYNTSFHMIGTYGCYYGTLNKTINVKVENLNVALKLHPPTNFSEVQKYIMHMRDLTSIPGWSTSQQLLQGKGVDESCEVTPSSTANPIGMSVHLLHASDVTVIGALGDTFTAGLGAKASSWNGYFTEYRGASWSIGGDGTLSQAVTLPNILKIYNKNLKGFSSSKIDWSLNMATTMAPIEELETQVKKLISEMTSGNGLYINFKDDWKVVTLHIGSFDLCHVCLDKERYGPSAMIKHLMRSLNLLKSKVPRLFVNLVLPVDVSNLDSVFSTRPHCKILGWNACPCVADGDVASKHVVASAAATYKKLVLELINSGIYDVSDKFAVVIQPFMFRGPRNKEGGLVAEFFGPDCIHLNTLGHASAATALWNNMLEPVGNKSDVWLTKVSLKCPTQARPYFATKTNSHVVTGMLTDDEEDSNLGMPTGAAVAIAVVLGAVVIGIMLFVWKSRNSRPRNEVIRLIPTSHARPRI